MKENNNKKFSFTKLLKYFLLVLGILISALVVFVIYFLSVANGKVTSMERVDEESTLYYCEYNGSYNDTILQIVPSIIGGYGCSSFVSKNSDGQICTARNYDFRHYDGDNPNALNVIMKISDGVKYKSLNMVDGLILENVGLKLDKNKLDEGTQWLGLASIFPYATVDGINEKGLVCSSLSLDVKDDEQVPRQNDPEKTDRLLNHALRDVLDNCASVDEAIELLKTFNYKPFFKRHGQMFITDRDGNHAVVAWRWDGFFVTKNDLVTNFYTCFDDAEDKYEDGELVEKYVEPTSLYNDYRYGYGHGYDRFSKVLQSLDAHRTKANELAQMSDEEIMQTIRSAAQWKNEGEKKPHTVYSSIYNNELNKLDIYTDLDYQNKYTFQVD